MGPLGLLIFGTRGNWGRLAGVAVGVGVGVLLALMLVAGANALETRDIRSSLLQPSVTELSTATSDDTIAARSDDMLPDASSKYRRAASRASPDCWAMAAAVRARSNAPFASCCARASSAARSNARIASARCPAR